MSSDADPRAHGPGPDYTTLPRRARLADTIGSVDGDPIADPDEVRNVEQHAATRDD